MQIAREAHIERTLFEGVRANLLWACPDATEVELWKALRMATAEDFVKHLPRGVAGRSRRAAIGGSVSAWR